MSSMLSRAACSPTSGLAPAPRPSVRDTPNWILLGTELFCRAWESVLQITKSTPLIPALNMWLMALLPPPPTPITFMTLLLFLRSEEHTSELQSRENLVCRLLLEKKKHQ